jgi:hypothetical protein
MKVDNLRFMTRDPAKQARGRTMVSALLYVEVAIIGALALWLIGLTVISGTRDPLPLIGVLLFALLGGGGLAVCARGYKNKKNFGRAPTVLANLIAIGVAKYQFDAGLWFTAVPIVILASATLYFALTTIPE